MTDAGRGHQRRASVVTPSVLPAPEQPVGVAIFAGGVPRRREGAVVGAVGVSGGSGEQDQSVAEAGAAAL